MVTQEDIARIVGCSQSLISKVLADDLRGKTIRPETRQKILNAAAKLGYRPNRSALALIAGRHNVLAVFLRYIGITGSSLTESLLRGITEVAERRGQRLMLRIYPSTEGPETDFEALLADLDSTAVDGLIFGGHPEPESTRELVRIGRAGLPVVRLRDPGTEPELVGVEDIQEELVQLGVEHLIERGCRRIAHLDYYRRRTDGYIAALAEAGLQVDPALTRPTTDYRFESGREATAELLADGIAFDAISAQSDQQAVGAMAALIDAGVAVGDDVKVVGVDDSPFCQFSPVPLTSVCKNEIEKGRVAVRMLLNMIDGRPVRRTRVEPLLRIRKSTG